ncbi:Serine/threonine protein kinase [Bosea sp. 62]|uniref:serine/threonine-protein kinase n=1 Tax=unclassified Bosea (in: a-proteobacteria) TaxID=2653178 RepID=UPI001252D420|nr:MULTISPECIES: serine/threonine-protein kinase [unclassified Bosea (in: a-proteobacteria)]CAD5260039.1 Serine/threonine protein kinase [Bosea sp. 46]CAD5264530.1 Serine/threonine protein kinase [Bosea sp. 21B]CAD5275795.1 Serine/threonine protein kinase [Bosea sp. 7B]VVT59116.1 Serine/threonine protein kinase [Bosea sp. EC-HK365B]VXB70008.1 Serine/threonine protein kinase [Bosea sp. 29B]
MSDSDRTVFMPRTGLAPGVRLNGIYEIERLIATGGMGEVYQGRAIQTGDAVAIKIVRSDMAQDANVIALFRNEASALHNLYNEAIVRYYVFTVDPATQATYLAMEFVDGKSLSDLLKQGPLPFEEVDLLRRRIASGLHAAHMLGITHRDVSPDNIILPGGQVTRAKIIDFGIAKSKLAEKTVIGSGFAGKFNYVSPEQLGLYGAEVTGKSDIYSLGLVLAEALGGRPLDMGGTQMQILEKRRRVPDLATIDKRIRPLLVRMLAPDPKDRPADMAEVASWQAKGGANSAGGGGRAFPWPRVAGVAALALLAGGGFFAWKMLGGSTPVQQAMNSPPPALSDERPPASPSAGSSTPVPELTPATPPPPANPAPSPQPASQSEPPALQSPTPPGPVAPPQPSASSQSPAPATPELKPAPTLPPATSTSTTGPKSTPVAPPPASTAPEPEPRTAAERTARYVADYDGGACFFLWPTAIADKRTTIEGFGSTAEPFVGFDAAFKKAQGYEAQISLRTVTTAQCPMVDFLRQLGRGIDRSPVMQIGAFTMRSGDTLSGTVESDPGKNLDILLIGDDGLVYNLANYTRREGGKASFNLKLESTAASGAPVRPQTVLALVSQAPLPALSGPNPAPAGDIFPGLHQDLARAGGKVGVGIKYFRIE